MGAWFQATLMRRRQVTPTAPPRRSSSMMVGRNEVFRVLCGMAGMVKLPTMAMREGARKKEKIVHADLVLEWLAVWDGLNTYATKPT